MELFLFFLTITTCFVLALFSLKNAKALNPQFLFCGFIGVIFSLASMKLFGMSFPIRHEVFIITIFGILFFSIGVQLAYTTKKPLSHRNLEYFTLNIKLVKVVVIVLLAWSVFRLFTTVLPLLMSGRSLDYVRMVYFGQEVDGISKSEIDGIIETFINQPFLYAIMAITAYDISLPKINRQIDTKTVILVFIWIVLSCLITGGRLLIYFLIVVLIFSILLNRNKKALPQTRKKKYSLLTFGVVGLLVYILYVFSIGRNDDGSYEFGKGLYQYFSGCVPHTSIRMQNEPDYTFGMTFFSGLLRPVMLVYKYTIGGGQFPEMYQRTLDIASTLQGEVTISTTGDVFNAFTLPFYYFYIDGDIIGVIIDSLIYGYFCGYTYFRAVKTKSHRDYSLYLIIIIYIFSSMIRFSPYIVALIYAYFFVMFCYKKRIVVNHN